MKLNDLLEIASFQPISLQAPNSWCGHLPFAAWLVQQFKPRLLVELGSHTGNSYFSFCQAVNQHNTGTECYAVDTWQGDEHAGYYGDEVYRLVNEHNQLHYAGFSKLLRMTFDEALSHIADGSVDLLHIDGLHTYEAVRHDFETWLPKLAPGAVVLFHDTMVRELGFGVWKLWAELQDKYPANLEFTHSHGLGVLQLDGPAQSQQEWLKPGYEDKEVLKQYFDSLGQRQIDRLAQVDAKNLRQAIAIRDRDIAHLNQTIAEREKQIIHLTQEQENNEKEITSLNSQLRKFKSPLHFSKRFADGLLHPKEYLRLQRDIQLVRNSAYFDAEYYLNHNNDIRLNSCNPLQHFCERGWKEHRNPSAQFDISFYLDNYKDVAALNINPLVHFIKFGEMEGRIGKPMVLHVGEELPPAARILVMDYRIPMSDISAGERATAGILADLRKIGYEVVFIPKDMLSRPEYEEPLRQLGVEVITRDDRYPSAAHYLGLHGHSFASFYLIRDDVAESVIDIIRTVAPFSKIIFHAPDLAFLRVSREAAITGTVELRERAQSTQTKELAIMHRVDHVAIMSPAELPILRKHLPKAPISVFPVLYASVTENPKPFDYRNDIFFLGGFGHPPNIDAVSWFVKEIWPQINAKLPSAKFHIIGSGAPEEIVRLGSQPGVVLDGFVKDLVPLMNSMRLGVAPIRYGAGIKGKVAMTLGAGIPCICTSIAAEGMGIEHGVHTLIADEPSAYADAVVRAYTEQDLWEALSSQGRVLVSEHFGEDANCASLVALLNQAKVLPLDVYTGYCQALQPGPVPCPAEGQSVDVSIIIPVYNQWQYTQACISSVVNTCRGEPIKYEIILADDGSSDETIHANEHFPGIRVIKTPINLGFLRNCNNAAKQAKGKYLLLLNNDTLVLPGWLPALYWLMEQDESIGITGSKLLYPDETLQEAGGLIWNDASAANCGRGLHRYSLSYNYHREVDYVSGASVLIRKTFWEAVGGFDERYQNAYCEDSDLAMTARAQGLRVIYQPASEVIHFEHQSYNDDRKDDLHPIQRENIARLKEKWADTLATSHLPPSATEREGMLHAERSVSSAALLRRREGRLNVLYFSPFPSHPSSHGNQSTIQQFGRRFQGMGHKVHFALLQSQCYSAQDEKDMRQCWDSLDILRNSHPLSANGSDIPFDGWYEEGLAERVRLLCAKYDIDVVFCSYVFHSKLLELIPSYMLKIIDTHDKMGNRYEMLRANGQPLEFFSCTPEEEGAYLRRADIVVARREEEARYFDSVSGKASAIVIPHVEDPHFIDKTFHQLKDVGTVASANRINLAIVKEFLEAIDRQLGDRECPFTIHVAGQVKDLVNGLPDHEAAIFTKPWVKMHGFIADIAAFYADMDVIISPVTMGTGINVKTVQAMAYGMPLLTTAWGMKGIETDEPLHSHANLDELANSLMGLVEQPNKLASLAELSRNRYTRFHAMANEAMAKMFEQCGGFQPLHP